MSEQPPDPPLYDALETLAKAQTPAELAAAHRTLRTSVKAKRMRAAKGLGRLATVYQEAMVIIDAQKASGVPFLERIRGLEEVLRAAWPKTRVWQFTCDRCADTGLVMAVCRRGDRCDGRSTRIDRADQPAGKYLRLCAKHPDSEYEHEYGTACFCALGARFRDKPKPKAEDFTAATQSKSMTKLGRK